MERKRRWLLLVVVRMCHPLQRNGWLRTRSDNLVYFLVFCLGDYFHLTIPKLRITLLVVCGRKESMIIWLLSNWRGPRSVLWWTLQVGVGISNFGGRRILAEIRVTENCTRVWWDGLRSYYKSSNADVFNTYLVNQTPFADAFRRDNLNIDDFFSGEVWIHLWRELGEVFSKRLDEWLYLL